MLKQLCYGSLREYPRLAAFLNQLLKSPLKRKDADINALLLVGLHQLLDLRIPDHAALSETVEACRYLGKPWATRLVNGVLRNALRQQEALAESLNSAARLRHPAWMLDALQKAWPDDWERIIDANNEPPPMCLRVNSSRSSRGIYLSRLSELGISASGCALAPNGVRLDEAMDVEVLPGFAEGDVSVQDEAAQLAADVLAPAPGNRVLDACAAPGGKACHLLERYPGLAELVAVDTSDARLALLQQNLQRLSLSAQLQVADARALPKSLGMFDAMLVDAPCSGSGVIRRHPDIKLLRRREDLRGFSKLQLDILKGLWPRLNPGGVLLYVTCSVFPEENQDCIDVFLKATSNAQAETLSVEWGVPAGHGRQLLPSVGGPDGLFFARLRKSN